jgi:hypothetical protein
MIKCCFGKHPPKLDYRTLRLANYLDDRLAPPPAAYDALPRVYRSIKKSDPALVFPMDGNDALGDCTIAALAHGITVFCGLVGSKRIMSSAEVVKLYRHLTGGPDSGLNMLDVLSYWRGHAVARDELLAYVSVNPKNHAHVEWAIRLFGGVYVGFQVQADCLADFEAQRIWTPGPLTQDGHAIFVTSYSPSGVTALTWGDTQEGTWAWWDECVDEVYALLPPEATQAGFAPGFNFAALKADLAAVAQ